MTAAASAAATAATAAAAAGACADAVVAPAVAAALAGGGSGTEVDVRGAAYRWSSAALGGTGQVRTTAATAGACERSALASCCVAIEPSAGQQMLFVQVNPPISMFHLIVWLCPSGPLHPFCCITSQTAIPCCGVSCCILLSPVQNVTWGNMFETSTAWLNRTLLLPSLSSS